MPKTTIKPHKVIHCGNVRYRVCVPERFQGPDTPSCRFFASITAAKDFAKQLNERRQQWSGTLLSYSEQDKGRIVRCLERAGSVEALEQAVEAYASKVSASKKPLGLAVAEAVKAKRQAGKSKKYVMQFENSLNRFLTGKAGRSVGDITAAEITSHVYERGWKPSTIHSELGVLATFFGWCKTCGYCGANPCDGVERPPKSTKAPAILTPEEVAKLLKACHTHDPKLLPNFVIGIFGGVRPDELRRITQADVKLSHGQNYIEITKANAKTRARRLVEINPTLAEWLALGGEYQWTNFGARFAAIKIAAGINWNQDCMRHSFCSYALPKYGAAQTALNAGHSEAVLFRHYRELVPPAAVTAFWEELTPVQVLKKDTDSKAETDVVCEGHAPPGPATA
jgi:integrase